ncbi:unnamed protein product, partial [Ilex paraguariensis]
LCAYRWEISQPLCLISFEPIADIVTSSHGFHESLGKSMDEALVDFFSLFFGELWISWGCTFTLRRSPDLSSKVI